MENILVTGVHGFLASRLVEKILADYRNVNIFGITRHTPSYKRSYLLQEMMDSDVNFIQGDICNYSLMNNVVTEYEIDTIIHLASNAIVRSCEQDPLGTMMNNVYGTAVFAELARQHKKIKHLICMASDKSYGVSEKLPYVEDETPLKGKSVYEASKTLADMWSQMYQSNFGVPITVIRSANLFGPGDSNHSRLIPQACTSISNNKNPWLWDGVAEYIREFVYVDDAVDFILNLIKKGEENSKIIPQCYNLGTGNTFMIKELVQKLINVTKKNLKIDIKVKDMEFKEIPKQYLSLEKSKRMLNWEAKYTGELFDKALLETYEYYDYINMNYKTE